MGSSTRAGTSEDKVTFTASKSGRYKVKVYGYRAGSYKLIVDVGGSNGGGAGKSFDTAITLRNSASGYVNRYDSVYYKFYVERGKKVTVKLKPRNGDQDLYIYNPSKSRIGSSTRGGTSLDSVTFTASRSGYYYAKVYGYRAGSYTISLSISSLQERTIRVEEVVRDHVNRGESKYYRVWLDGKYKVELKPRSGDPDLYVYKNGREIGRSTKGGTAVDSVTLSGRGWYKIKVIIERITTIITALYETISFPSLFITEIVLILEFSVI